GFGKRSSAYEYRRTGRGGQGLTAHGLGGRAGDRLAAAFPVEEGDDLRLVTSGGQMIRTPVDQIRVVGRASQGVTIFRTADGEKVVSVERLPDSGGEEAEGDDVGVEGEDGGGSASRRGGRHGGRRRHPDRRRPRDRRRPGPDRPGQLRRLHLVQGRGGRCAR